MHDPFYKASDSVKASLDAHSNVEIRVFNPLTLTSFISAGNPLNKFVVDAAAFSAAAISVTLAAAVASALPISRSGCVGGWAGRRRSVRRDLRWVEPCWPSAAQARRSDALLVPLREEIAAADYA